MYVSNEKYKKKERDAMPPAPPNKVNGYVQ
jgi:hypothetical protein